MSTTAGPTDVTGDPRDELARAQERVAALERLIRQERAQYLDEQRRAAQEMARLKARAAGDGLEARLAQAQQEIKELSRYKRQVERLERSPFYGPVHRLWTRFRLVRGYEQKAG